LLREGAKDVRMIPMFTKKIRGKVLGEKVIVVTAILPLNPQEEKRSKSLPELEKRETPLRK
jgi:hypothetical protein